eukprot:g35513.t1
MAGERQLAYTNSSRNDLLSLNLYRSPVKENIELLSDLVDDEPSDSNRCERWDISALEDFTKYTKVDLWNDKELDLLGLDEHASPYQNEAEILRTPTLAELNADDSQLVTDSWCLLRPVKEASPFSGLGLHANEERLEPENGSDSEQDDSENEDDEEEDDDEDKDDFSDYLSEAGEVPEDWKMANVVPPFKKGGRDEPGNYRL